MVEVSTQASQRPEGLNESYRIPLATRQRLYANNLACRAGMVLEELRNAEKFETMPSAVAASASKDMVVLELDGFWRGNGGFGCKDMFHGQRVGSRSGSTVFRSEVEFADGRESEMQQGECNGDIGLAITG